MSHAWSVQELHHTASLGATTAPLTNGLVSAAPGAKLVDNDREILAEHEKAIQRLELLQKDMIGGEKTGGSL